MKTRITAIAFLLLITNSIAGDSGDWRDGLGQIIACVFILVVLWCIAGGFDQKKG